MKTFLVLLSCVIVCLFVTNPSCSFASKPFIENKGQLVYSDGSVADDVLYYSSNKDFSVYLRMTGISYVFNDVDIVWSDETVNSTTKLEDSNPNFKSKAYRIDLEFVNPNQNINVRSENANTNLNNYYLEPQCPDGILGVREFRNITFENLFDNIDFSYSIDETKLKYEFVIRPGGDPKDIKFKCIGNTGLYSDDGKDLMIESPAGKITDKNLLVYQDIIANQIPSRFNIKDNIISFDIGIYNEDQVLIIDPEIEWSTFSGGNQFDMISGIASENDLIYTTGSTRTINLPTTPGVYQELHGGLQDIFVHKVDSKGNNIWLTYIGSSGRDGSFSIDVRNHSIWIGGQTNGNFPTTPNAIQDINKGGSADAIIVNFDDNGQLIYSSYYGGPEYQATTDVKIDSYNNVFFVGRTFGQIDVTENAFQKEMTGNGYDSFVLKFNDQHEWLYGSYITGTHDEFAEGIAIDNEDNIIISGFTGSSDFYIKNPIQNSLAGQYDSFLMKLNNECSILWSTYYGGTRNDYGSNVEIDHDNNIYLYGITESDNLLVSDDGYQNHKNGISDYFIVKFGSSGNIEWVTYFGGSNSEGLISLNWLHGGIDISGDHLAISGFTKSEDFPVLGNDQFAEFNESGMTDAFLSIFTLDGELEYSTYLGGEDEEYGKDVVFNEDGDLFCTGFTKSSDFPIYGSAFMPTHGGDFDGYIVKFSFDSGCDDTFFEYTDFSLADNIKYVGKARLREDYARLTQSKSLQIGGLWHTIQVPVDKGFVTEFSFRMDDATNSDAWEYSSPGADGIAFVIQNNNTDILGTYGGGIGYEKIPNSIAIEIDLFNNGNNHIISKNDSDGNHVSVHSAGLEENSAFHSEEFDYGTSSDFIELISDGTEYWAKIVYDNSDKLEIYISDDKNYGSPVLTLDDFVIGDILDLTSDELAYIGFTSATASAYQSHDILYWYFCADPTPLTGVEYDSGDRSDELYIYPNPSSNIVNIKIGTIFSNQTRIELFDMLGNIVLDLTNQFYFGSQVISFSTQKLISGTYLLRVSGGKEVYSEILEVIK